MGSQGGLSCLVILLPKPPRYRSYLLTIWEEQNWDLSVPVVWRFSLEDPHTGQRHGFVGLEEEAVFLQRIDK